MRKRIANYPEPARLSLVENTANREAMGEATVSRVSWAAFIGRNSERIYASDLGIVLTPIQPKNEGNH